MSLDPIKFRWTRKKLKKMEEKEANLTKRGFVIFYFFLATSHFLVTNMLIKNNVMMQRWIWVQKPYWVVAGGLPTLFGCWSPAHSIWIIISFQVIIHYIAPLRYDHEKKNKIMLGFCQLLLHLFFWALVCLLCCFAFRNYMNPSNWVIILSHRSITNWSSNLSQHIFASLISIIRQ